MRKTKKSIISFVAVMMFITTLILETIPEIWVNATTGTTKVVVKYDRSDGKYEGWNLWIWDAENNGEGKQYDFTSQDGNSKIAEIDLPYSTTKIGVIVRKGEWEEKDTDEDRFVEISNDQVSITIKSGVKDIEVAGEKEGSEKVTSDNINLRIHYSRFDEKYDGWNLWLWKEGKDGQSYEFTSSDSYGKVAEITLDQMKDIEKVGFIVRKGEWEEKDIDEDRFITVSKADSNGNLDVYLLQGDKNVQYNADNVDKSPKILVARIDNLNIIRFETNVPLKSEDIKSIKVFQGDKEIGIDAIVPDAGNTAGIIKVSEKLAIGINYTVKIEGFTSKDTVLGNIYGSDEFENLYYYDGDDLGAVYSKDKTIFKLWAPTADNVELALYEKGDGGEVKEKLEMKKEDKGIWSYEVTGDNEGTYYTYLVTVDGNTNEATDPYAKAVGVNGNRAMVIDLSKTNPEGWDNHKKPELKNPTDSIIYELHVRDLSMSETSGIENQGKFLGVIEEGTTSPEGEKTGLDHLKDLGITHLHLLPSFDFKSVDETKLDENKFNWGYDPQNYNAPEGSYSTDPYLGDVRISEFKQMVKGLHDNGIRVVMDVVYNHTGKTQDSHLNQIVPNYYYRQNEAGTFSNGSGCGNEIASERAMVRKMIVDSVVYWAKEYKVDGFRFDLMGLHDIETMNIIREELDKIDPTIIMYGEGWTGGSTPLKEADAVLKVNGPKLNPRIALFSDDFRDGVKGHVFEAEKPGFANGLDGMEESVKFGVVASTEHEDIKYGEVNYSKSPWAQEPSQTINYVSAHDNLTLWDKIAVTNPEDSEEERIKIDKLAQALVLTSQGIPFIHAGEEFLRTKDGDHNSYQSPDSVNQLDWSRKSKYKDVYEYYKGLIALRKEHPAFRMTTTEEIQKNIDFIDMPTKNMIGYTINNNANGDSAETVAVLANANKEDVEVLLPSKGWNVVVNGEKAGIKSLSKVNGNKVIVPARTMLVLTAGKSNVTSIVIGAISLVLVAGGAYIFYKKRKNK